MLLPEALREDAETEIDPAAAEEQGACEEDARGEDADGRVRAPGQVLIDSARPLVLLGEQGDRIGDGENAESRDQHRQRRVPAGAVYGIRHEAEHDRRGEHRPDRQRLGDRSRRSKPAMTELASLCRR